MRLPLQEDPILWSKVNTQHQRKGSNFILKLFFLLAFTPRIGKADVLPFPAESCQSNWSNESPTAYLYEFGKDSDYPSYVKRMQEAGRDRKNCHKTWTVLIYMSATQDLIPYAYADLLEMEAAHSSLLIDGAPVGENPLKQMATTGSSLRSDVIVQLATDSLTTISRFHMFETSQDQVSNLKKEDLSKLVRQNIHSPEIMQFNRPMPATESQLFEDFLRWGIEEYPSEHYVVIIWGHGQGWTAIESSHQAQNKPAASFFLKGRYGGLALDGNADYLDIPSLRKALKNIEDATGDPIAVFASDACLMQSVEDVTELADCAQYICGSEDIESYAGFPYGSLLCQLNSGIFDGASSRAHSEELSQSEPYLVSWMIPQLYKDSFDPNKGSQKNLDPIAYHDLTGCAISAKHLRTSLVPALNRLGASLINFIEEESLRWIDIKELIHEGPFFQGGTQDLGAFLQKLSNLLNLDIQNHNNGATKAAAHLRQAIWVTHSSLNYTVVNAVLGDNYPVIDPKQIGPRGISIWLPESDDVFFNRFEDFSNSRFWSTSEKTFPGWKTWLMRMYPKGFAKAIARAHQL